MAATKITQVEAAVICITLCTLDIHRFNILMPSHDLKNEKRFRMVKLPILYQ